MAVNRMRICPSCGYHMSGTTPTYGSECPECGYDIYKNWKNVLAYTRKMKKVI